MNLNILECCVVRNESLKCASQANLLLVSTQDSYSLIYIYFLSLKTYDLRVVYELPYIIVMTFVPLPYVEVGVKLPIQEKGRHCIGVCACTNKSEYFAMPIKMLCTNPLK